MPQILTLNRTEYRSDGTFGNLLFPSGLILKTGELPWQNNARGVSCIPLGIYKVDWTVSPKFGLAPILLDVPNRQYIRIHAANSVGLAPKYIQELNGCIALGISTIDYNGQRLLYQSRKAIETLKDATRKETFFLRLC